MIEAGLKFDKEIQAAALQYVDRLFSRSGDSDLIKVLRGEAYTSIYRKMLLEPDEFHPLPQPVGIEPWHGRKPEGLDSFLKSSVVLPALPQSQMHLQQVLDDPDAGAEELVEVISRDPKLVAAVLRLANKRQMSSGGQKVDTPRKAVEILGVKEVGSLVMGAVTVSLFKRSKDSVLSAEKFWKHSIACALIAQEISKALAVSDPDRYFVEGILHDIGLFLIFESNRSLAFALLEAGSKGRSLQSAENELLGFTHSQMSGFVLEKWGFPSHLVAAAAGHHNPLIVKNDLDAMVIHLADFIARALGYDLGLSFVLGFIDYESWKKTGLSGEKILQIMPTIRQKVEDFFRMLGDSGAKY